MTEGTIEVGKDRPNLGADASAPLGDPNPNPNPRGIPMEPSEPSRSLYSAAIANLKLSRSSGVIGEFGKYADRLNDVADDVGDGELAQKEGAVVGVVGMSNSVPNGAIGETGDPTAALEAGDPAEGITTCGATSSIDLVGDVARAKASMSNALFTFEEAPASSANLGSSSSSRR